MALPGEFEHFDAGDTLVDGTLADHRLSFYQVSQAGVVPVQEAEYRYYLQVTGLTRQDASFADARRAFYAGATASTYGSGTVSDHQIDYFAP